MIEQEAKTKWCPQVRMDGCEEVQNSFNRVHTSDGSGLSQALCVASDCMMWEPEYEEETKTISRKGELPEGWHKKRNSINYTVEIGRYVKTNSGDCGLKAKECGGCQQ